MKKFWAEFKKFFNKGNALNLAIAVVIGNSFTAITNNLVSGIITPLISILTGGISVEDWKVVLKPADEALGTTEIALALGKVLQAVINFLIIALTIFMIVKIFTKSKEFIEAKSNDIMNELNKKGAEKQMIKELKAKGVNVKDKEVLKLELEKLKQEKLAATLAEQEPVAEPEKPTIEVISDTLAEIKQLLSIANANATNKETATTKNDA